MNVTTETNMSSVNVKISGMSCAACASRIEKGLLRLPGVASASVNFAAEKALVNFDPKQASLNDILKKVEDLGFEIVSDKVEFKLSGMSCSACAARIEKGLLGLPGVYRVNVNFAAETAVVDFNANVLSIGQMQDKVKKLGFEAHNVANASEIDKE